MLAFVFPGQGSQTVGMGKALAEQFPVAQRVYEEADAALGRGLAELCFSGPSDQLTLTANAQPAILTTSIAALRVLQTETALAPSWVAGHSLGEYSALVCAGAIAFADAVRIVHLRGKLMQEAVPAGTGGMAALMGGDAAAIQGLCDAAADGDVLSPANFNGGGQVAIAGTLAAIDRALSRAKEFGIRRALKLPVSAPFHCRLMAPAADRLAAALGQIDCSSPTVPVITNVEARENSDGARVRELLVRQVTSPVRWEESAERLAELGVTRVIEIGPGKVLTGLLRRINKDLELANVETPQDVEALAKQVSQ